MLAVDDKDVPPVPQKAHKDVCGADAVLGDRSGRTKLHCTRAEDRKLLPSNWASRRGHTQAQHHQAHPGLPRTKTIQRSNARGHNTRLVNCTGDIALPHSHRAALPSVG